MGNEIYYCVQCGVRVRGADFELPKADRSYCASCVGHSQRIRRVSSSSSIRQATVAARPRGTDRRPRKTGRVAVLAGVSLLTAAVAALASLSRTPSPAPVDVRPVLPVVAVPAAPAPQSPPAPAVEVPPDPLRADFLRGLEGLKEQAFQPADAERGEELLEKLAGAVSTAPRLAPEKTLEILEWQKEVRARYEALADSLADPISEAAGALADEGRRADALGHLRSFPKGLRRSRAWSRLEALERQIQGAK